MKYYKVDTEYDWKTIGRKGNNPLYVCRYCEGAVCTDRNCAACGFNPEVARRRERQIRKRMEEQADGTE